jgi:diguanylate cyclase (GGDEF)-like protein
MRVIQSILNWREFTTTQNLLFTLRRIGPPLPGLVLSVTALCLLAIGTLSSPSSVLSITLIGLIGLSILARVFWPQRTNTTRDQTLYTLSMFLPALTAVWIAMAGLPLLGELLFPVALLTMAWVAATLPRNMLAIAAAFACALEVSLFLGKGAWAADVPAMSLHLFFVLAFALGGLLLLRREVVSTRIRTRSTTRRNLENLTAQADSLGLTLSDNAPLLSTKEHLSQRLSSLHTAFEEQLRQTRLVTGAHSAILMMRTSPDGFHVCRAITPDQSRLNTDHVSQRTGLLALLAHQPKDSGSHQVLRIHPIEGHINDSLPYYTETPSELQSLMAAGIWQNDELVGALWLDKAGDAPFSDADAQHAELAIRQITRTLSVEHDLLSLSHRTDVLEHFMKATETLIQAFEPGEVHRAVLEAAARFTPLRYGALVVLDAKSGDAKVVHAVGERAHRGVQIDANPAGSIAMAAIRTGAISPVSHRWSDGNGTLCGPGLGPDLKNDDPVLALPLTVRDTVIGALVLVPHQVVNEKTLEVLTLLAGQTAMVVEHAQSLADLSARATTDSLTGIDNRATIQQKLEQAMARADRNHHQVALLMLDIDHFKQVNDTHGHQMGDRVLEKVATVLDHSKRINDAVGRYGGEEFAIVLENTGDAGGRLVADRLRKHISDLPLRGATGTFRVTVSVGLAVYPDNGGTTEELVQRADNALYQAKNNGRNQVRGYLDTAPSVMAPNTL